MMMKKVTIPCGKIHNYKKLMRMSNRALRLYKKKHPHRKVYKVHRYVYQDIVELGIFYKDLYGRYYYEREYAKDYLAEIKKGKKKR